MNEIHQNAADRERFTEAVTNLLERLYGSAMRFTRNHADAEDLVSEVLSKAWQQLHQLDDWSRFDGWMMRILSNSYISKWRREKVRTNVFDDDAIVDDLDDSHLLYARLHQPFLLWWGTPEQTFVNNLLSDDIEAALGKLPDGYRIVITLIEVMGFSYDEAAKSLDVPIGTIRSRLSRGRKLLQNALWHHAVDAGLTSGLQHSEGKND